MRDLYISISHGSTARKIPFIYSFPGNCAASVPISTLMCLWAIYIFSGSVHIFSCSRIGRSIMGMHKSLTDTWMWKLGLLQRNSFSGNFFLEFLVLVLCSVTCPVSRDRDPPPFYSNWCTVYISFLFVFRSQLLVPGLPETIIIGSVISRLYLSAHQLSFILKV